MGLLQGPHEPGRLWSHPSILHHTGSRQHGGHADHWKGDPNPSQTLKFGAKTFPFQAGKLIRLVRVLRIMRIFKLVRHFAGLQSLIYTLNQAYKELGLLMLLVGVAVLTFASLVYFAEKDSLNNGGWTFLDSFWWGIMTLTTVGYDHKNPETFLGKVVGGLCALVGIFILTLPIPIVVNSFASYYKNR